jgi:hypothetical protein
MQGTVNRSALGHSPALPNVIGLGGAVAGLLAGAVMVVLSPILSLLTGLSVWEPPKLIAATVLGERALSQPGFDLGPVLLGGVLHFVTSIILGIIFGVISHRVLHLTTDFGLPIYVGLCYGMLIFFVAYFVILPGVNPAIVQNSAGMGPLIAQNLVFGLVLGIFYTWVRPEPYTNTRDI